MVLKIAIATNNVILKNAPSKWADALKEAHKKRKKKLHAHKFYNYSKILLIKLIYSLKKRRFSLLVLFAHMYKQIFEEHK